VALEKVDCLGESLLELSELILLDRLVNAWVAWERSSKLLGRAISLGVILVGAQDMVDYVGLVVEVRFFYQLHHVLQLVFAVHDALLEQEQGLPD